MELPPPIFCEYINKWNKSKEMKIWKCYATPHPLPIRFFFFTCQNYLDESAPTPIQKRCYVPVIYFFTLTCFAQYAYYFNRLLPTATCLYVTHILDGLGVRMTPANSVIRPSLFDKAENGQNVTQGKLGGHSLSRQWSIKRSTKAIESKAVVCETSCWACIRSSKGEVP